MGRRCTGGAKFSASEIAAVSAQLQPPGIHRSSFVASSALCRTAATASATSTQHLICSTSARYRLMHATAKRVLSRSLVSHGLLFSGRQPTRVCFSSTRATTMTTSPPPRGAFILLEGLDRSGKTTQTKLLAQHLSSPHSSATAATAAASPPPACVLMRFPDRSTAIGQMLDSYLRQSTELDDRAVHLLFAANRWEAAQPLTAHLTAGTHVVVDRYSYSGAAFTAAKGYELQWCWGVERGLPAPDVVIFLSVKSDEAEGRGGWGEERYEKAEVQARVREQFARLRQQEEGRGMHWVVVDGGSGRSIEDIAAEIRHIADRTIERAAHTRLQTIE